MDNQSEAEFLANEMEAGKFTPNILQNEFALRERAAAELRRLHAVNAELLEAARNLLSHIEDVTPDDVWEEIDVALWNSLSAAIANAQEQSK